MARSVKTLHRCTTCVRLCTRNVTTTVQDTEHESEWVNARPFSEIPGPRPLPFIGNAHRFILGHYDFSNLITVQTQLRKEFGDIVIFPGLLSRNDLLFLYKPEDVAKVFRQEGHWPERPPLKSLLYYRSVLRRDFFQGHSGVLNDQGEKWQAARSKVNPVMMQTRIVQMYTSRVENVAEDFIKKILSWRDSNNQMPETFVNEMHKWALESIALIALDTRLGCLGDTLAPDSEPQRMIDAVHTLFKCMHHLEIGPGYWTYISTPTWRKFVATNDYFVKVCMKYITQAIERMKEKKSDESSVLERFLERDPNTIRAVVMALDMFLAGVDTTSYSTINTLLHLCKHPEVQDKLYGELQGLMPDPMAPITLEKLNEMKYLRACIRESLRMTPVATGNIRTTRSEIVLSNYQIPKGVDIIMANGAISRMEQFFPQASKFVPERWLREQDTGSRPNPFASLPFGHGARKCVGMRFASLEMELLLAKLVRRYKWEWHYPEPRYISDLLLKPVDPLRFTVLER